MCRCFYPRRSHFSAYDRFPTSPERYYNQDFADFFNLAGYFLHFITVLCIHHVQKGKSELSLFLCQKKKSSKYHYPIKLISNIKKKKKTCHMHFKFIFNVQGQLIILYICFYSKDESKLMAIFNCRQSCYF